MSLLASALQPKREKDRHGILSLARPPQLISEVIASSPRQSSNRVLVVVEERRAESGREEEAVAKP